VIVIAFRRREHKVALEASFLICGVLTVDTLQGCPLVKAGLFQLY